MKTLQIAEELALPIDAATQKIAWLGRTGSGKTFAVKRMIEQMLRHDVQVVVLDSMGVYSGLRLGRHAFDIPVLGGLYGDIVLEPTAGALVADVIVDSARSVVLDVSQMTDAERTRFATAWANRFFQRKKASPSAVHVPIDEAEDFVPQNPAKGEERMLHEFTRLSKQGRAHGIGVSFVSQRPQEINKKALNQAECVFAFQMTGTHERKALEAWLTSKGADEKLSDVLPRLDVGVPHVWSPQWLRISKTVHILPIDSLDTSRTPKVGEKAVDRSKLKPIDLKALEAAMVETLEKQKLEDPKALRERVREYELEIQRLKSELLKKKPEPEYVEFISEGRLARFEKCLGAVRENLELLERTGESMRAVMKTVSKLPRRKTFDAFVEQAGVPASSVLGVPGDSEAPLPKVRRMITELEDRKGRARQRRANARVHPEMSNVPRGTTPSTPPEGWSMEEDELYQKFKARLIEEAPSLVKLLTKKTEVEVQIERQVVTLEASSLRGRVARLLADGFFDEPRTPTAVKNELCRTGPSANSGNVGRECEKLLAMSLLTKERDGYLKAPGVRVTAKAVESER